MSVWGVCVVVCEYADYATVCECVVCVWLHVGVW